MKRTTTYGYKNDSKKKYIWISVGVVVILAAAIAVFYYFYQNNENKTAQPAPTESVEEQNSEQEEKTEENESNLMDEGNTTDSNEEQGESEQQITNNGYIEGQPLPTEPTFVEGVLIANKKYPLPSTFAPGESEEARNAFEQMATDARIAGFELVAFSSYRSFEYQDTLYHNYVNRDGQDNADRYSARPGYSEHQTGLAFDIGEKGKEDLWLTEEFGETEAGKWLVENAHKYGFILRYPQGKEEITGYMYESWHFRYLGVDLAGKVKQANVTLEEYLGVE
ncbi:M15 family metallopeptidase [Lysinibacillus sp. SGAir0095]|uniref:M15 family metallopeptidase n=1 Tax=Lysinibacillus sp. SGAir0095 TaxID=2070463 RepID=UPI0010CD2B5A|nr:M15 family metallopeptidase [Lysinibacillus sp. SGAir0095]QCR33989.1 D-alanyl-D-alanine carboxypeptidase [Lysinibacillus sp. SGAir0095]